MVALGIIVLQPVTQVLLPVLPLALILSALWRTVARR